MIMVYLGPKEIRRIRKLQEELKKKKEGEEDLSHKLANLSLAVLKERKDDDIIPQLDLDSFYCFNRFQREILAPAKFIKIPSQSSPVWVELDTDWLTVWESACSSFSSLKTCAVCQLGLERKLDEWRQSHTSGSRTVLSRFLWKPHCNDRSCKQYVKSGNFGEKKGNAYSYGWF